MTQQQMYQQMGYPGVIPGVPGGSIYNSSSGSGSGGGSVHTGKSEEDKRGEGGISTDIRRTQFAPDPRDDPRASMGMNDQQQFMGMPQMNT